MRKIEKQIIKLLSDSDYLNSAQLANKLNRSIRTIKNDVKGINIEIPSLILASRKGYQINKDIFKSHLELLKEVDTSYDSENRFLVISHSLLERDRDFFDLSDNFFISESTLKNDLKKIKDYLKKFSLSLKIESHLISIKGNEKNKRKAISDLLYKQSDKQFISSHHIQNLFPNLNIAYLEKTIKFYLDKQSYYINDYALSNLILHTAIMIDRLTNQKAKMFSFDFPSKHYSGKEYDISQQILTEFSKKYIIEINQNEVVEFALLIASRTSSIDYNSLSQTKFKNYIPQEILSLVSKIFSQVEHSFGIDLFDTDLTFQFALHINNLMVRANNNYLNKNPLSQDFKKTYPLIFEVAIFVSNIIENEKKIKLDDDEIAFLAFHLGNAIENQKERQQKLRVGIFCPNYYNMASQIVQTLTQHFGFILLIDSIFTKAEKEFNLELLDFVISTTPNQFFEPALNVTISPFLTEKDLAKIQDKIEQISLTKQQLVFENQIKTIASPELFMISNSKIDKKQCIEMLTQQMFEKGYVLKDFKQEIWKRENLSSTSFNNFAIPHSLHMDALKTGLCFLISKIPIIWDENKVNLVLMMAFNREDRQVFNNIYEHLTKIMSNKNNIKKLALSENYNQFIERLTNMV